MEAFRNHPRIRVSVVITNRSDAGVRERAGSFGVPHYFFPNADWAADPAKILAQLAVYRVDFVLLAGFLRLIPGPMLEAFPGRILNIHPSLLPQFGGKGLYGIKVHEAVCRSGQPESGMTIHLVDSRYDEGPVLFQARCPVLPDDSPRDLADRVLKLEHAHYAQIAAHYITSHPVLPVP